MQYGGDNVKLMTDPLAAMNFSPWTPLMQYGELSLKKTLLFMYFTAPDRNDRRWSEAGLVHAAWVNMLPSRAQRRLNLDEIKKPELVKDIKWQDEEPKWV